MIIILIEKNDITECLIMHEKEFQMVNIYVCLIIHNVNFKKILEDI